MKTIGPFATEPAEIGEELLDVSEVADQSFVRTAEGLAEEELSQSNSKLIDKTVAIDFEKDASDAKLAAFGSLIPCPIPAWKRVMDVSGSIFLLVVLSPLLIAIALLIRIVSRGPVLFKQSRLGEMGNEFVIYKFRTLKPLDSASQDHRKFVADLVSSEGAAAKPNLAHRYIWGGELLRSTSLDELPQLLNILRGEMSFIGPRPEVLSWDQYRPWQLHRFEVRPGVTGLWQVSGKNKLSFNQMVDKDLEYISKRSLGFDLWILMRTVFVIFNRDNT